ncbi:polysaccharide biosynthesis/export family protein [Mucilaginibacter terrae]|uniref:polysaccharide biosynthesis/export family protein n=1 Tax=Mucilaginibacter terrae TaxID=1955052 RepID=UPI0036345F19
MKKKDFHIFILLLSCLYLFSSCRSVKQLTLFQKVSVNEPDTIAIPKANFTIIQPGDILSINVTSLSSAASTFFNPYGSSGSSGSSVNAAGAINTQEAPGYLVDENGNIELPLIGSLKLSGLSTLKAKAVIRDSLTKYLKEPTLTLRVINYKITLLGEVSKPAVYTIPNERVTLPEVISLGGDLTAFGRRDNVLIIRDNNGKKEFGHVNLNTRELYKSPYYYLRSNDLVYVEPSAGKAIQNNSFFKIFPLVASIITLSLALFTRVL